MIFTETIVFNFPNTEEGNKIAEDIKSSYESAEDIEWACELHIWPDNIILTIVSCFKYDRKEEDDDNSIGNKGRVDDSSEGPCSELPG